MTGDNCSSSCLTRDHESFGECCRSKNIKEQWLGGTGASFGDQKKFARTNANFRQAVADGLNPSGVNDRAINRAYEGQ